MLQHLQHWWHRRAGQVQATTHPAGAAAWPSPGQPQAQHHSGHWLVGWHSRASPHHANQDCAGAAPLPWPHPVAYPSGVAVAVADGVTLAAAGAVAAQTLVRYWLTPPPESPALRSAWLAGAEEPVAAALRALTPEPGAATGAAAWLGPDGSGWCTRVGDCRVLRAWRQPGPCGQHEGAGRWCVQPLLPDQTLAAIHPQHFPDPHDPDGQQPAHFVGCGRLGVPDWVPLRLAPQELLILASDGLHASLSAEHWHNRLSWHLDDLPRDAGRLQALAWDLVNTAHDQGSEDDITALVLTTTRGDTP